MRYDTVVNFYRSQKGTYNPNTGNYSEPGGTAFEEFASVTDSSAQTMMLAYGALKQGSLTIRLQQHYERPFDEIYVNGKKYSVDLERRLRNAHIFVVSEVQ